ncbi:MAG: IPExxxVDY family protein [Bacteroidota bacterium]|nr:IPExxxVDY family protein [Bacteroidota bacterium]
MANIKFEEASITLNIPFALIGMVTPLANFQVAYRLQQNMSCEFEKTDDFLLYKKKMKKDLNFHCLLQVDITEGLSYMLLDNLATDNSAYMITELKRMDYILLVIGRDFANITTSLCKELQNIHNISFAKVFYTSDNKIVSLRKNIVKSLEEGIEYFRDSNQLMSDFYI